MDLDSFKRLNSNMKICVEKIDKNSVLIIDNFYANPEKIRDIALSLDYGISFQSGHYKKYPGERAVISFWQDSVISYLVRTYAEIDPDFRHLISRVQKQPLIFTIMNDSLRDIHLKQMVPHIDYDVSLVAIVYLTFDCFCEGGTAFYRHRETGLSYFPPIPSLEITDIMQKKGFNPLISQDYIKFIKFLMYDGIEELSEIKGNTGLWKSNASWEFIRIIPMKFNRLIIFPGKFFHSPVYEFDETKVGGSIERKRLTQNLFVRAY